MLKNLGFIFAGLVTCSTVWAGAPSTTPTTAPSADALQYAAILTRMNSADRFVRDCGAADLEWLPESCIPMIEATANASDTVVVVRDRLQIALPRMKGRSRVYHRKLDQRNNAKPFQLKLMLAAYDNDGHSKPDCIEAAHTFLNLMCQVSDWTPEQDKQYQSAIKQIRATHCDDPTILTEMLITAQGESDRDPDTFNQIARAKKIAESGKCDPYTKIIIDGRIVRGRLAGQSGEMTQEHYSECVRTWDDMCTQFSLLMKTPGLQIDLVHEVVANIAESGSSEMLPHDHLINDVYPNIPANFANDPEVLSAKGRAYVDYAWNARGGGVSGTVSDAQWALFHNRLVSAEEILTQAYTADPFNPTASDDMLAVMLGKDTNLAEMQQWYLRAMLANPDDYEACTSKLLYLEPKWHGNSALMLAFAHQCFETRNWRGQIPFILQLAHYNLCQYFNPADYFLKGSVWGDLNLLYSTFTRMYPHDELVHANYAYYASLCHQYKIADQQFDLAGEGNSPGLFKTTEAFAHCKAETKQMLK